MTVREQQAAKVVSSRWRHRGGLVTRPRIFTPKLKRTFSEGTCQKWELKKRVNG